MSWKDKLFNASFRGVPFKVRDSATEVGRRSVLHQFSLKDYPYVEDLGKEAQKFTIEAYIIQNKENDFDYFTERDNLIKEIEKGGSGELSHPFYGTRTVSIIGPAKIRESFNDGGIARFTMNFVQTTETVRFPSISVDNKQGVDTIASTVQTQLENSFKENYQPEDVPGFSLLSMTDAVLSYAGMIRSTISSIRVGTASTIATALGIISEIESTVAGVIHLPENLMSTIQNGFNGFLGIVGLFEGDFQYIANFDPEQDVNTDLIESVVSAAVALSEFGQQEDGTQTGGDGTVSGFSSFGGTVETIPVTTTTRARQAANRIAITNFIRGMSLITACRIAVRGKYTSYEEAIAVMNEIVSALDAQILKLGNEVVSSVFISFGVTVADENTYNKLEQIRPIFITAMFDLGASLAKVVTFDTPPGVLSTLVLAYDKYKDLDRAEGIFGRNQPPAGEIKHPGFLSSQPTIEILSE